MLWETIDYKTLMTYVAFILVAVFLLFVAQLFYMENNRQKGYIYIIPEGYKGKLVVVFNKKGAPPLKEKEGFHIVKFPPNGYVETSSTMKTEKMNDEFYYYTNNGKVYPAKDIRLGGGMSTAATDGTIAYKLWINEI